MASLEIRAIEKKASSAAETDEKGDGRAGKDGASKELKEELKESKAELKWVVQSFDAAKPNNEHYAELRFVQQTVHRLCWPIWASSVWCSHWGRVSRHIEKVSFVSIAWVTNTCETSKDTLS